jgi:hypothetical protein
MKKTALALMLAATPAWAQEAPHAGMDHGAMNHGAMDHSTMDHAAMGHDMPGMPGMSGMPGMGAMHASLGFYPMNRESSGTSWQPDAAPMTGGMTMAGDWMLMTEARLSGVLDSQSGPRGDSQAYSSGMGMVMASRDFGADDTLGLRLMLSSDPFMGRRGYPLLLQSGETADGVSHLVDRQHPHDLLMEMAASWSHRLDDRDSAFLYAGYPGEPALGPSAYMHRLSAMDNPMTPISHHWLDSTHVTFGVLTAGFVRDDWKLEVSQFTGREPDQYRFDFDSATFDSTAVRLSWNPDPHWSLQVSGGWLKSPEQLDPGINERRLTASATYFNAFDFGTIAATFAVGNKHLSDGTDTSGFLLEAEYKPDPLWTLFARAETIGSAELVPEPGVRHAGELSLGLIRDFALSERTKIGLGGLYAFDFVPGSPTAPYGSDPHGAMAFIRLMAQ